MLAQTGAQETHARDAPGAPPRCVGAVRHPLGRAGPKVLASRMVRDYVEQCYAPAAQSLRRAGEPVDGTPYAAARRLADYRRRVEQAWPRIEITDVDSTGLPDTPLLGSELTLTATVRLAGLAPDEVTLP